MNESRIVDIESARRILPAKVEAEPIHSLDEYLDPHVVKVVLAESGLALYFSRAPIPWNRDAADSGLPSQTDHGNALRHIGIYAYRRELLLRLTSLPPGKYERLEKLEQLRVLELGETILVSLVDEPTQGIDTPADYAAFLERRRAG